MTPFFWFACSPNQPEFCRRKITLREAAVRFRRKTLHRGCRTVALILALGLQSSWAFDFEPREINIINVAAPTPNLPITGEYAIIAAGYGGILALNSSSPTNLYHLGNYNTGEAAKGVAVAGLHVYVADGLDGLNIIDISNPTNPLPVGKYPTPDTCFGVAVKDHYAYLTDKDLGLLVIDVANPAHPQLQASVKPPGNPQEIVLSGSISGAENMTLRPFKRPLNPS